MNGLTLLVLLYAAGLALCSPGKKVPDGSIYTFFCEKPGCADDVKAVYFNDVELLKDAKIPECTGLPPPQKICQHAGQAFVSTDTNKGCEFEGDGVHLETKNCTGNTVCAFNRELTEKEVVGVIAGAVVLLALIIALIIYCKCCKRRQMTSNTNGQDMGTLREPPSFSLNGTGDRASPSQHDGA